MLHSRHNSPATPVKVSLKRTADELSSTPLSATLSSCDGYTSHYIETGDNNQRATEMKKHYRVVPIETMLGYLPDKQGMPSVDRQSFKKVVKNAKKEVDMYKLFITAMKKYLNEDWELVDTSGCPDTSRENLFGQVIKPDMALYKKCGFKHPIFATPNPEPSSLPSLTTRNWRISRNSSGASLTRRRISAVLTLPSNVCCPMIQTRTLLTLARNSLRPNEPLFKVYVPAVKNNQVPRGFYVSREFTRNHLFPISRGTRCFAAYCPIEQALVLLKATWRVVGYTPELDTYKLLHDKGVRHIPTVLAAGDAVGGELYKCGCGWEPHIRRHILYFIVLREYGKSLQNFDSTHELVTAVRDAFIAHRDAYEKAGVLHRDISYGNIIIHKEKGYLIDWEMSREMMETSARAIIRTGTWQFLSVRMTENIDAPQEIDDDIESFIWVLLWTAARYAPNGLDPKDRAEFLARFDYNSLTPATAKKNMISNGKDTVHGFAGLKLENENFEDLLAELLDSLHCLYQDPKF